MRQTSPPQHNRGFTLVELLVVIAIIGVIIGLLLPGIQSLRAASRRSVCQQLLTQISLALTSYHQRHAAFPIGTIADQSPIRNEATGFHHNWIAALLPQLDCEVIAENIDHSKSVYAVENEPVRNMRIPLLRCPSVTGLLPNTACYAGIHHSLEAPIAESSDGVFRLNVPTRISDVSDGLTHTLFIGEKISHPSDDLGWFSGTRSTLRNTGSGIAKDPPNPSSLFRADEIAVGIDPVLAVGGLSSHHPNGIHLLMGAGEVLFRSVTTDEAVLQQMANRSDGQLPMEWLSND